MIREFFDTDKILSQGQINWLRCIQSLPSAKEAMGAKPNQDDFELAKEASEILKEQSTGKFANKG